MRPSIRLCISILCLCIVLPSFSKIATAHSSEEATWLYFYFPPIFMKEKEQIIGFGVDIMDILFTEMTDYEQRMILAPPKRMVTDLKEGRQVLVLGMLKSPSREQIMYYSKLPCRLGSTSMIAMRTEDKARLAPNGTVSIKALFKNDQLNFGYIPGANYGKLQELVTANKNHLRAISAPEGVTHLMDMIIRGRIDWTIVDPQSAAYLSSRLGFEGKIVTIPTIEHPLEFIPGYFTAPKTVWGKKILEQIDTIMRKRIRSGQLFNILSPYVPPGQEKQFKQAYDALILKPALQ